tara:strand:- start:473 stop:1474 length:1002 start_codon:yes stop_codon:yes gene_type:complete
MPVIIFEKDLFVDIDQQFQDNPQAEAFNVRRPIYGITLKDTRFAYMSLYQDVGDGNAAQVVSLLDSSAPGGYSDANHNFILQGVSESRQEKVQIIETFGDHFAFFYGEKPIVLQIQGMLFNTADFNWKNEFMANYENFLRGTKCAENRTRVFLGWDDVVAQGYLLNVQIQYNKDMPLVIPFSCNMLLTKPPTDLSNVMEPLNDPTLQTPPVYRSLPNGDLFLPEYLTDTQDVLRLVTIDPITGIAGTQAEQDAAASQRAVEAEAAAAAAKAAKEAAAAAAKAAAAASAAAAAAAEKAHLDALLEAARTSSALALKNGVANHSDFIPNIPGFTL